MAVIRRLWKYNGLSIVLLGAFLACWTAQIGFGWRAWNQERRDHGAAPLSLSQYLHSGHFIEATAENWESEFLQMAAFVWLTSFLYQWGSPESSNPHKPVEHSPVTKDSPWPVRRGGWALALYARSLALTLLAMFALSFALHAWGGAIHHAEEQALHGQPVESKRSVLISSEFWFQSMQNWQSEFLSIGMMVVLAIFLRQKGSPESKPVEAPHAAHE